MSTNDHYFINQPGTDGLMYKDTRQKSGDGISETKKKKKKVNFTTLVTTHFSVCVYLFLPITKHFRLAGKRSL